MTDAIPDDIVKAADRAALDSLGRGYPTTVSIIARALMAEREAATKRERERCAAIVKVVGETFLLDMTAKPDWQDAATWGRQETIRHTRATILKGEA